MKTPFCFFTATLAGGLIAFQIINPTSLVQAQVRPGKEQAIANLDARPIIAAKSETLVRQLQGEAHLKSLLPVASVDYDARLGTPKFIRAVHGYLTGPNGEGAAVSAAVAQAVSVNDPHRSVKTFLNENSGLFGFGSDALSDAVITRESVGSHNGLRTVVWQQQLDGLPIFESVLIGNITSAGELVSLASGFVSEPAQKADAGNSQRATLQAQPTISSSQAILAAAASLGDSLSFSDIVSTGATTGAGYQKFLAQQSSANTRLVWLSLDREKLRLAWEVIVWSRTTRTPFQILVDAETGNVYLRRNLSRDISNATYNVYTSDSPSPFSPAWPTPNNAQPSLVNRVQVTTSALDTTASPNGWINDGDNETQGNNADTFTDRDFDQTPDGPRPQGNPSRVFDFTMDLTQAPLTYSNASTVQLFYLINTYHDRLYQLGFTEAVGNFQNDNFGRGGLGNDRVIGYVQAGADVGQANNAFFSTPPDGFNGEMAMFVFDNPLPNRDGDLDAEVVFHEATHGTSQRLVGGGVLISALQTDGMGEGWGDFVGLSLLSEASDNPDAVYADGGYPTFQFFGLGANYYFGIRHFPYTTDMTKNPFTFKDIDPGQISAHSGVPRSPVFPFSALEADEVHHQGEVWCTTLWEVRANLVRKHGYAGNQLMLQLVIDAMKLSPANPTFLEERDAVLLADQVNNGGANYAEIWRGFAKRGMGISATSPDSSTTVGVHEAFDLPGIQIISTNLPGGNGNHSIDPNECNTLYLGLQNLGVIGATGVQVTLGSTNANVIVSGRRSSYPNLPSGFSGTNQIALQFSTSPNFVCGTPVNFSLIIKCDQFTQTNYFTLPSGSVSGVPLRYDSIGTAPIPDLSSGDLPLVVTNFPYAVMKATVSLYITHTYASDLVIQLISPDGVVHPLATHVGDFRDNFGGNCSDARTTFDDDAAFGIGAGAPPFIGTFRPESPLSVFVGMTGTNVNGTWHLHVIDDVGIDFGEIECWSLFLSTPACTDGGGECPGSDLAIGGSAAPEPVIVGGNLTYNLSITNLGPKAATGVTLTHVLAPSTVYITSSISQGSISPSGGSVNASIGNMAVGAVVNATITVLPAQAGTITATATAAAVTDPDPDLSNNSITLTSHVNPPTSDMVVGIVGTPNPVLVGGTLTYTITVTNKGPSDASGVVVSNNLASTVAITSATPSQGTAAILGNAVIFNFGAMNVGAIATATITVIPSAGGQVTATANVRANQFDPISGNNTAAVSTSVSPAADLAVGFQNVPASIVLGNNLTYTINATNLGPSTAIAVFISQTLPPDAVVISSNSTAGTLSLVGNVLTCDVGSLPMGGVVTMTVQVSIPIAETVSSSVNISGGLADSVPANNSATASTIVALPFVNVQPAGATVITESVVPPNGSVEPGETVTVQFRLSNLGNIATTNLMARLLASGGVTSPTSSTLTYGVLTPGGLPVPQLFSFTASGTNGGSVVATLQLSGDASNNVTFTFKLAKVATFVNTNVIVIPAGGSVSPYPSTINVSGVTGLVGKVTITLSNFNHTFPHDVNALVVSPTGAKALFLSHACDMSFGSSVDVTFDDSAAAPLPDVGSISSGTFRPSVYGGQPVFPNPAPSGPYDSALSVFNASNPNGTWALYVYDDVIEGDAGGISNGWSIAITTINPVNQTANLSISGVDSSDPILAGDNLTYTFTVTNNGTNVANNIAFTNTLPANVRYISTTLSQGSFNTNAGKVYANLGALNVGASATVTIVVSPNTSGVLSSTANVSASQTDLVPANNTTTVSTTVNLPAADVSVIKTASVGTAVTGSNLVYTISVANNGPSTALNVVVTDPLPVGVSYVSSSAGVFAGGTFTCGLGNIASGASSIITVTTHPTTVGNVTNTATVATDSTDSVPGNNSSSVSTIVRAPAANISAAGVHLLSESLPSNNGTVEPGETVSVSLALANAGELNTANLVATLANTGGVTASSGSMNYGAVLHNSTPVSRTFTFTASPTASGAITATLSLQDGANNLGTVAFTFALPQTNSFSNTNAIIIPDHGNAAPYPSTITVAGLAGFVGKVSVTLNGLTHAFPKDVGILLVSPSGAKSVVMSGAGGGNSVSNLTLSFFDAAVFGVSDTTLLVAGDYRPTSYPAIRTFPSPAPAGAAVASFSPFNGTVPNGTWSLYVVDDVIGDGGIISDGWTLNLTAITPVNPTADLSLTSSAGPSSLYMGHTVTYSLFVTNNGPSAASGVIVTNLILANGDYGPITVSQGSFSTNLSSVTWNVGSVNAAEGAMMTLLVNPTMAGLAVDTAQVVANETDLNFANNSTSLSVSVLPVIPARLAGVLMKANNQFQITLTGQPDLTYIIMATTNLANSAAWKPISTNTAAGNGMFQFTDTNSPGLPQRFYRAIVAP